MLPRVTSDEYTYNHSFGSIHIMLCSEVLQCIHLQCIMVIQAYPWLDQIQVDPLIILVLTK